MPGKLLANCFETVAHDGAAHTLLDRLAAADTGGDLTIGIEADQLPPTKYRLRLLGGAGDEILHQHLVGKRLAGAEIAQRAFKVVRVAYKPDAAACGADRILD